MGHVERMGSERGLLIKGTILAIGWKKDRPQTYGKRSWREI